MIEYRKKAVLTRKDMPKPLKRYPITYAGKGGAADSIESPTMATTDAAGAI